MAFYGYNFTKQNGGGLGAIIHDILNATKYAEENNLVIGLIREGYNIPRLNGSIDDSPDTPNNNWHTFFNSFPIVDEKECIEVWPNLLPNSSYTKWDKAHYHNLLVNKVCIFKEEIKDTISLLVSKTPFNKKTDIVLHIRQTDKIEETNCFIPIEVFINECNYALQYLCDKGDNTNRIYICTDNKQVCEEVKMYFSKQNVEVYWDDNESTIPLHPLRNTCQLKKSIAQFETMNAFKNLFIMKEAKYLIGGRMSYFFRIAELLGYPNKCVNLQDNDKFGVAPYSEKDFMVRPYYKKTMVDFINPSILDQIEEYKKLYKETGMVTIPSFVSHELLAQIEYEIIHFKWWVYSIHPDHNTNETKYLNIENIDDNMNMECLNNLQNKQFCYRFKRSYGKHYDTCICIACKLTDTLKSFPVTNMLCNIIGCRNVIPREIFISNYGKDDFLSLHHDKNKGDISVTFSFTSDWHPTWGGILHFCDKSKNIYKSIQPSLGSVNIFKLDPMFGLDHFVSSVSVNKNRYTLTSWYSIDND
jgi:Rps23 Pro-64 3,4-dihydroxylase Tpa1-like proline 4-hydroxylase